MTMAAENISKAQILELKEAIVRVLKQPYFLEYADSPRSGAQHFDQMISLPCEIKKFYNLILLHPEFKITDIVEESGHTLATLAAESGYAYLMPHFKNFKIDLNKPDPNGLTPSAAAKKANKGNVLQKLEDMGIIPAETVIARGGAPYTGPTEPRI
jgi:hypothetical protein